MEERKKSKEVQFSEGPVSRGIDDGYIANRLKNLPVTSKEDAPFTRFVVHTWRNGARDKVDFAANNLADTMRSAFPVPATLSHARSRVIARLVWCGAVARRKESFLFGLFFFPSSVVGCTMFSTSGRTTGPIF